MIVMMLIEVQNQIDSLQGRSRLHPKGSRLTPVKKEHRYMAETNLNQLQKWLN